MMSSSGHLWITTRCDVDGCGGTVRFGTDGVHPRRVGACDRCGEQYSLYAGEIRPLPHADPGNPAPPADIDEDRHLLAG